MLLCLIYCLGCVNFNTNTRPTENRKEYENVASWSACSDLCRARTDCQFWTWCNENMGAWALKCITMSNIPTIRNENNIVSGGRNCAGEHLPFPFVFRKTLKIILHKGSQSGDQAAVQSWQYTKLESNRFSNSDYDYTVYSYRDGQVSKSRSLNEGMIFISMFPWCFMLVVSSVTLNIFEIRVCCFQSFCLHQHTPGASVRTILVFVMGDLT